MFEFGLDRAQARQGRVRARRAGAAHRAARGAARAGRAAGRFRRDRWSPGMDGAGKSEVIHRLLEWLDPRHRAGRRLWRPGRRRAGAAADVALLARPAARGEIAVVFGSWYSEPLRDRLVGADGKGRFERELAAINRFEEMLADEGTVLLKFLLVAVRRGAEAPTEGAGKADGRGEPGARGMGRRQASASRRGRSSRSAVRRTSTSHAPWTVLPCDDPEYRDLSLGRAVLACLQAHLEAGAAVRPLAVPAAIPNVDRRNVLDTLDLASSSRQGGVAASGSSGRSPISSSSHSVRHSATGR